MNESLWIENTDLFMVSSERKAINDQDIEFLIPTLILSLDQSLNWSIIQLNFIQITGRTDAMKKLCIEQEFILAR
jgi:hypothetical protein